MLAGPTASGKTQLAIHLAKKIDGEIINADSMQVYKDFQILSSRPSKNELKLAKHHLYGFQSSGAVFSTGKWLKLAADKINKIVKKDNFRSSILDNEGNILAKSVPVINIGINPNLVINKEKLLISLKLIFPNKSFNEEMYGKKFFYVKKKLVQKNLSRYYS